MTPPEASLPTPPRSRTSLAVSYPALLVVVEIRGRVRQPRTTERI